MTYHTNNALGSADPRDLYDNAEAFDQFVNSAGATYSNRLSVSKPTLADLVADANQALADVQDFIDGDIALLGAAVYVDEATGRAAVADGEAFKVQGNGDIAAYEYRRVNAGSSTLIATYPASAAVTALFNTQNTITDIILSAATSVFSRGSYLAGSSSSISGSIFGWKSVFKHNGQPFSLVRFTFKTASASATVKIEIWQTNGTVLGFGECRTIGGETSTTYAVYLNREITELADGDDAYIVVYHSDRTVAIGNPAGGAYAAEDANPTTYPDQYFHANGTWVNATPNNGYRIQFDAINTEQLMDLFPNINTQYQLRNAYTPYVMWAHTLGDSEMAGNSNYSSTIAGFYEQATELLLFNAAQFKIWAIDQTTNIEWKIWIRDSSSTFNMSTTTPNQSGTILAGQFPSSESIYTLQIDNAVKVNKDQFIFVMFLATNGAVLYYKKWLYNANITPARHGFPFVATNTGWNNTFSKSGPTLGFGQTAPKFLLESLELRTSSLGTALGTSYDNATSGLLAINVQSAIDEIASTDAPPELIIPPLIYAVEGMECNVYIDNLHVGDSSDFYHDVVTSNLGTQQNERWTWIPAGAVSNQSMTIQANNKRTGVLMQSASTQLRAAAASSGSGLNKKVMVIGDSLISTSTIVQTLVALTGPDVMDITLIGMRGAAPNWHEGRGGWTINNYTTAGPTYYEFTVSGVSVEPVINSTEYGHNSAVYRVQEVYLTGGAGTIIGSVVSGGAPLASGTLTKSNEGIGDATIAFSASTAVAGNPFWISGALNFAQYLSDNSLATPDWVLIQLGTNDVAGITSDASALSTATTAFNQLDGLISSIKSADVSTRVGLMIPPPPSSDQDSFGANYGAGINRHRFKRNILIWARELIAKYTGQEANRIYIVPSNTALDTVHNMSYASATPVNSRNSSTVQRQSNGVHPAISGYQQIADAVWAFLKYYA